MNLGELLDGAFRLLVRNWRPILLVAAVVLVPLEFATTYLQREFLAGGMFELFGDPEQFLDPDSPLFGFDPATEVALGVLGLLGSVLLLPFLAAAVSAVVAGAYLGREVSWTTALARAGRRWWALLASRILVSICQFAVFLPGVVVLAVGIVAGEPIGLLLGVLLLLAGVVAAFVVMGLFVATVPAIAVEQLGPLAAMGRSARLMRRRLPAVVGTALLAGLLAQIVGMIVGFVPTTVGGFLGEQFGWLLVAVGNMLTGLFTTPFVAIVATLLYFDGRIRNEAFDLQAASADLGGSDKRGGWDTSGAYYDPPSNW